MQAQHGWRAAFAAVALGALLVGCGGGGTATDGGGTPPPVVTDTAPQITSQPQAASVTEGQTATFTVAATGSPAPTYQWRRNGSDIAGATSASYTTGALAAADDGASYAVVVTNAAGSVTSTAAVLSVTAAPPTAAAGPRLAVGGALLNATTIVRSAAGAVWAWGGNAVGKVGNGTLVSQATPYAWPGVSDAVAVTAGNTHVFAVRSGGGAWGAGQNVAGELGTGTPTRAIPPSLTTPTAVTAVTGIRQLVASQTYSAALLADGTVWHWGQLPDATSTASAVQVAGLSGVTSVCVNGSTLSYGLALKGDGTVWYWGYETRGALAGQGHEVIGPLMVPVQVGALANVRQISCGFGFALALAQDGRVWQWGAAPGANGAPGTTAFTPQPVAGLADVAQVSGWWDSAVAVTTGGQVWAWGSNADGQLGLGDTTDRTTPQQLTAIGDVVEAAAGYNHTVFLKRDGTVWATGANGVGQLGRPAAGAGTSTPVQVDGLVLN